MRGSLQSKEKESDEEKETEANLSSFVPFPLIKDTIRGGRHERAVK